MDYSCHTDNTDMYIYKHIYIHLFRDNIKYYLKKKKKENTY